MQDILDEFNKKVAQHKEMLQTRFQRQTGIDLNQSPNRDSRIMLNNISEVKRWFSEVKGIIGEDKSELSEVIEVFFNRQIEFRLLLSRLIQASIISSDVAKVKERVNLLSLAIAHEHLIQNIAANIISCTPNG